MDYSELIGKEVLVHSKTTPGFFYFSSISPGAKLKVQKVITEKDDPDVFSVIRRSGGRDIETVFVLNGNYYLRSDFTIQESQLEFDF